MCLFYLKQVDKSERCPIAEPLRPEPVGLTDLMDVADISRSTSCTGGESVAEGMSEFFQNVDVTSCDSENMLKSLRSSNLLETI